MNDLITKQYSTELFTKRQNFRPDQIQSICRRQNSSDSKIEIYVGKSRKYCGKRRKCWLPAISPFPTMFSKAFFSKGVKSRDCVVKSEITEEEAFWKQSRRRIKCWQPAFSSLCATVLFHLKTFQFRRVQNLVIWFRVKVLLNGTHNFISSIEDS